MPVGDGVVGARGGAGRFLFPREVRKDVVAQGPGRDLGLPVEVSEFLVRERGQDLGRCFACGAEAVLTVGGV